MLTLMAERTFAVLAETLHVTKADASVKQAVTEFEQEFRVKMAVREATPSLLVSETKRLLVTADRLSPGFQATYTNQQDVKYPLKLDAIAPYADEASWDVLYSVMKVVAADLGSETGKVAKKERDALLARLERVNAQIEDNIHGDAHDPLQVQRWVAAFGQFATSKRTEFMTRVNGMTQDLYQTYLGAAEGHGDRDTADAPFSTTTLVGDSEATPAAATASSTTAPFKNVPRPSSAAVVRSLVFSMVTISIIFFVAL